MTPILIIEAPRERRLTADWRHIHRWWRIARAARRAWGPETRVTIGVRRS